MSEREGVGRVDIHVVGRKRSENGHRKGGRKERGHNLYVYILHVCTCTCVYMCMWPSACTCTIVYRCIHISVFLPSLLFTPSLPSLPSSCLPLHDLPNRTSLNWQTFSLGMPLGLCAVPAPPRAAISLE